MGSRSSRHDKDAFFGTQEASFAKRFAKWGLGYFQSKSPLKDRCRNLTIRDKEGRLIPFNWSDSQDIYWKFRERAQRANGGSGKVLVLKYRQGGFTTLESADSYETLKHVPNSQQVFLAEEQEKSKVIFNIVRRFLRLDPFQPLLDGPPSKSMITTADDSWIYVGTAGSRSFGRGFTLNKVHGSEVSRWPGDYEQIDDLVAGLCEAAAMGMTVMETTANGMDPWFYRTWFEPRDWHRIFIPWFFDPANRVKRLRDEIVDQVLDTLTDEELSLIEIHGLDVGQIAWRRAQRFSKGRLFLQEFPEDPEGAFLITGATLFDQAKLLEAMAAAIDPPKRVEGYGNEEEHFIPPRAGMKYYIGGDVAEGVEGGDNSGFSVRDAYGALCRVVKCHDEPMEFAYRLAEVGYEYNTATVAPESNSVGRSTVDTLVNVIGYPNVYVERTWNGSSFVESSRKGWPTTPATKPVMLRSYKEDFENGTWDVPSKLILADMRRVVRKNNSYETGGRDLFMADAITKEIIRREIFESERGGATGETVKMLGFGIRGSRA